MRPVVTARRSDQITIDVGIAFLKVIVDNEPNVYSDIVVQLLCIAIFCARHYLLNVRIFCAKCD